MAAYDELLEGSGQDKFLQLYQKYDLTMIALKSGTTSQVLTGQGTGSSPTYTSFWSSELVVGGGGAPAYGSGFTGAGGGTASLRFRKSLIMDFVEINGLVARTGSSLANGASATIFTLPVGYRPTRPQSGCCRSAVNNILIPCIVDSTTGEVIIVNTTGSDWTTSGFGTITILFPLS